MKVEKLFIKNRKGEKVVVLKETIEEQKGLAIVMHGLSGFKEQPHIRVFVNSFLENKYSVITFDTTNTLGESDGDLKEATTTNYYEDLEDVIEWAKKQDFYKEPFCLAGHSLGGLSVGLYAENYPQKIKAVASISPVVSGKIYLKYMEETGDIKDWKEKGYKEKISESNPGVKKIIKWGFMEDVQQYDLIENADKLAMPVLIMVGELDTVTPVKHQEILFEKLPKQKKLCIIKGAPHTFRENKHLQEIKKIMSEWIKQINS
jgi:alpha-beta hydrolase superfamily lysophospholipase